VSSTRVAKVIDALGPNLGDGEAVIVATSGSFWPRISPVKEAAKTIVIGVLGAIVAAAIGGGAAAQSLPTVIGVIAVVTDRRLILLQRGLFGGPTPRIVAAWPRDQLRLLPVRGVGFASGYRLADRYRTPFATLTFPAWLRREARELARTFDTSF
jgi:hypothetical protein